MGLGHEIGLSGPTPPACINSYVFIFFAKCSWTILACAANPPAVLNWMISAPSSEMKLCGAGQKHTSPAQANVNRPVKVDDPQRALQDVSPVFNPAQIVPRVPFPSESL